EESISGAEQLVTVAYQPKFDSASSSESVCYWVGRGRAVQINQPNVRGLVPQENCRAISSPRQYPSRCVVLARSLAWIAAVPSCGYAFGQYSPPVTHQVIAQVGVRPCVVVHDQFPV